jgi:hypothetical protein
VFSEFDDIMYEVESGIDERMPPLRMPPLWIESIPLAHTAQPFTIAELDEFAAAGQHISLDEVA